METNTPIDHKRVQGIIVFIAGVLIARFTDWEIGAEDLAFGVGEIMYVAGILWSYFGGMVAQGPINWGFGDKVTIDITNATPDQKENIKKFAETINEVSK